MSTKQSATSAVAEIEHNGTPVGVVWTHALNGFTATLTAADIADLRDDPAVISVEPDSIVTVSTEQSNPPWGLDRIDQGSLPLDHDYSYGSTGLGVTAYVVDSGVRTTHAEFTGRIARGYDATSRTTGNFEDCYGHGTHVAGILGGTTYGVAKNVSLVPVKVFGCSGSTTTSTVIAGLDWVVADHHPGVPAVANLSLGGSPSSALDAAVNALIAYGVTVVVAAGNATLNTCDYSPGRVPAAITVGASDRNDDVAYYSNHGACNDLFAPGTSVLSAGNGSDTATLSMSGTSMAAPHVAGAAARILQAAPTDSPAQVRSAIDAGATTGVLDGTFAGDPNKLLRTDSALLTVVPSSPVGLGGARGDGQVALTWSPPATDNGSPVVDYVVQFRTAGGTWSTFADGASPATSAIVTGLANGSCYELQVAAVNALGAGPASIVSITPAAAGFTSVVPQRLFDTRPEQPQGAIEVAKTRYGELRVDVAGVAGIPPSGIAAVSLNVTAVNPTGTGFVTVYPCGDRPLASSLNYSAGQTVPNAVITSVSPSGEVCFYASTDTDLVADLNGWFPVSSGFTAQSPQRVFDTRPEQPQGAVAVGKTRSGDLRIKMAGAAGVPPLGVDAVSLNVTAVDPSGVGYVTVYPCGERPLASSLNVTVGQTVPNAVIAPLSPSGEVCFYASADTDLVADVNGWFATGSSFTPIAPVRSFDTRRAEGQGLVEIAKQPVVELRVRLAGAGGLPPTGVAAVSLNVTAVGPVGPGFVTVYPCGQRPLTSSLNFATGQTVPNAVIAPVSADGDVCFYASAATDLVADVNGWYATS